MATSNDISSLGSGLKPEVEKAFLKPVNIVFAEFLCRKWRNTEHIKSLPGTESPTPSNGRDTGLSLRSHCYNWAGREKHKGCLQASHPEVQQMTVTTAFLTELLM